jgi:magnesium-transporting ATPase (P-type)
MFEITQRDLDKMNVEQARDENKRELERLGGLDGLLSRIGVSLDKGLSHDQIVHSRDSFGQNKFPVSCRCAIHKSLLIVLSQESPMKPFYMLVWEALNDTTLIILMAAAIVSLVLGILEDPNEGWIEGSAILFAVFVVSMVSSVNDYTKELQFRALEQSSQRDERCSVLRNGEIERLNPVDLVVGDIVVFQVGEHCTPELRPLQLLTDSVTGWG